MIKNSFDPVKCPLTASFTVITEGGFLGRHGFVRVDGDHKIRRDGTFGSRRPAATLHVQSGADSALRRLAIHVMLGIDLASGLLWSVLDYRYTDLDLLGPPRS